MMIIADRTTVIGIERETTGEIETTTTEIATTIIETDTTIATEIKGKATFELDTCIPPNIRLIKVTYLMSCLPG